MILKASERGKAAELARHLMKAARAQQHEAMQELTREVAHYARLGRDAPPVPFPAKEPKRARTRKEGRERERGARRGDAPDFNL